VVAVLEKACEFSSRNQFLRSLGININDDGSFSNVCFTMNILASVRADELIVLLRTFGFVLCIRLVRKTNTIMQ
jgi:hypothetical protein